MQLPQEDITTKLQSLFKLSVIRRRILFWEAAMISRNFKNILVVSIGFLSLFTAYGGLQSLQVGEKLHLGTRHMDIKTKCQR